ncbi:50S ribosomal protein L29 [Candidatus Parcubacteria bacterium]|nr:50S ribosomal protein L29 [Candidatus Parcubacteria bacterium]
MKPSLVAPKTVPELRAELMKSREELRQLRFAAFATKPKNVRQLRTVRRGIARLLTALRRFEQS